MDDIIHQATRLRIMAMLVKHRDVRATTLRDALGLTDGNLATHANKLEAAGYAQSRRTLDRNGFHLRIRITPAGAKAFHDYVQELQALLE